MLRTPNHPQPWRQALRTLSLAAIGLALAATPFLVRTHSAEAASKPNDTSGPKNQPHIEFKTSDRCVACHNGMKTASGQDYSIGLDWRASIMANAARDPYWQGSIRREAMEHPESKAHVEDDCSSCHMAIPHLTAKSEDKMTEVFSRFPIHTKPDEYTGESDGVTCTVCHQIEATGLGTRRTFNGEVVIAKVSKDAERKEYGPYLVDIGHEKIMHSSTGLYLPQQADHIRDSALCASCHTLYTRALGDHGETVGELPEQMPYQEWQHSDYNGKQSCQYCHMPEIKEPVPVTALYGQPRDNARRHVFVGSNFVMENMLREHAADLSVKAPAEELAAAAARTAEFLKTQAAHISIENLEATGQGITFDVHAENLGGHKLPTAFPSRRAWLHITVRDRDGKAIFESGAVNPDGSITGNDNDADPTKFEPHYREITRPDQVEIFEAILENQHHQVTTGLLAATDYAKDNRILPHGFDKQTADHDIRVAGDAHDDPGFNDHGSTTRYKINLHGFQGATQIEAELCYQPIGYRWAQNLKPYQAMEPQRFVEYFDAASKNSSIVLAKANASR